jgi:hypothetical protein
LPTTFALLDEITVTLAVAGLVLCLLRIQTFAYRLLAMWFAVALVVTGIFSEYDLVTISRLHYALPPLAAFAAIAVDRAIASRTSRGSNGRCPPSRSPCWRRPCSSLTAVIS